MKNMGSYCSQSLEKEHSIWLLMLGAKGSDVEINIQQTVDRGGVVRCFRLTSW